jgi:hypothetical protein
VRSVGNGGGDPCDVPIREVVVDVVIGFQGANADVAGRGLFLVEPETQSTPTVAFE